VEGQVLGIADRMQTIAAMFGIGLEPTGSKDPFALRRAANAIVKILAESGLSLTIRDVRSAAGLYPNESFFRERVEFYLREICGFSYDVVTAVMKKGHDDVRDAIARAAAVTSERGSEDLKAVATAFKRMNNILRQAGERDLPDNVYILGNVSEPLLRDPAELALHKEAQTLAPVVERLRAKHEYRKALEQIATLRPHVDLFFDKVMVMVEDEPVRHNRLALIAQVLSGFSSIADFSELVSA